MAFLLVIRFLNVLFLNMTDTFYIFYNIWERTFAYSLSRKENDERVVRRRSELLQTYWRWPEKECSIVVANDMAIPQQ